MTKAILRLQLKFWQFAAPNGKLAFVGLLAVGFAYVLQMHLAFLREDWPSMGAQSIWPIFWFDIVSDYSLFLRIFSSIAVLLYPALALLARYRLARLGIMFILFIFSAVEFNRTQTHAVHFVLWAFLPFVLCDMTDEGADQGLGFAQLQVLLIYCLASVWKLGSVLFGSANTANLNDFLSYAIAQEYINSNKTGFLGEWILPQPSLAALLSVGVLGFQLSSFIAVFLPRTRWIFGLCAIAFHLLTGLILQIHFVWAFLVILVIFILPNVWKHLSGPEVAPSVEIR